MVTRRWTEAATSSMDHRPTRPSSRLMGAGSLWAEVQGTRNGVRLPHRAEESHGRNPVGLSEHRPTLSTV
jgi:hypothetical protein